MSEQEKSSSRAHAWWKLSKVFQIPWLTIDRLDGYILLNLRNTPLTMQIRMGRVSYDLSLQSRESKRRARAIGGIHERLLKSGNYGYVVLGSFRNLETAAEQAQSFLLKFLKDNPEHLHPMPALDPNTQLKINYSQQVALLRTAGVDKDAADIMARVFAVKGDVPETTRPYDSHEHFMEKALALRVTLMELRSLIGGGEPAQRAERLHYMMGLGNVALSVTEPDGHPTDITVHQMAEVLTEWDINPKEHLLALGFDPEQYSVPVEQPANGEFQMHPYLNKGVEADSEGSTFEKVDGVWVKFDKEGRKVLPTPIPGNEQDMLKVCLKHLPRLSVTRLQKLSDELGVQYRGNMTNAALNMNLLINSKVYDILGALHADGLDVSPFNQMAEVNHPPIRETPKQVVERLMAHAIDQDLEEVYNDLKGPRVGAARMKAYGSERGAWIQYLRELDSDDVLESFENKGMDITPRKLVSGAEGSGK